MKKISFYLLASVLIAFVSCKKGDTGPQGPAGPAGANGSANVSYGTVTVTPGTWSSVGTGQWEVSYSDAAITDADQDMVIGYVSSSTGTWWALPTTNYFTTAGSGDALDLAYSTGNFTILYTNNNVSATAPTVAVSFKVVVIPPAIIKNNPSTNWNDYNQVKKFLNEKDSN